MPKIKNIYLCEQCGTNYPQWHGQCPECNAWGSIHESFAKNKKNETVIDDTCVERESVSRRNAVPFSTYLSVSEERYYVLRRSEQLM